MSQEMSGYPLTNNRYIDFVKEHEDEMRRLCESNTNEDMIILFDIDLLDEKKPFNSIVFMCDVKKLPEYAYLKVVSKRLAFLDSRQYAIKHCNLCLISDFNPRIKWNK